MGVNIVRVDKHLEIIKDYGYFEEGLVDVILGHPQVNKLKCLKYLDKYDNTFFNSKQWSQLKEEIDFLEGIPDISDKTIRALFACLYEINQFPDQYFGFIGD